jgi:hypothetical protein
MGKTVRMGFVLLAIAAAGAGCASSEQWKEWKSHSSHFASGDHMTFSLRNQGKTPRVNWQDQRVAAGQSWWGDPVVVRADQIFQS